jgi:hypothetical protein
VQAAACYARHARSVSISSSLDSLCMAEQLPKLDVSSSPSRLHSHRSRAHARGAPGPRELLRLHDVHGGGGGRALVSGVERAQRGRSGSCCDCTTCTAEEVAVHW